MSNRVAETRNSSKAWIGVKSSAIEKILNGIPERLKVLFKNLIDLENTSLNPLSLIRSIERGDIDIDYFCNTNSIKIEDMRDLILFVQYLNYGNRGMNPKFDYAKHTTQILEMS